MSQIFTNNGVSTLAGTISAAATSLSVQSGDGILFPSPTPGTTTFSVVLENRLTGVREFMECTNRVGDQMFVTRAQEGTSAQSWPAGTLVSHRLVASVLNSLSDKTGDETVSGDWSFTGETVISELRVDRRLAFTTGSNDTNWDGLYLNDTENTVYVLADGDEPLIVAPTQGTANVSASRILTQNGSRAAPAYSFSSVSDMGFYRPSGVEQVRFTDGSVDRYQFNATGVSDVSTSVLTRGHGDSLYLAIGAKASDANLLDGLNSTQFLRSDANDTMTADLRVEGEIKAKGGAEATPSYTFVTDVDTGFYNRSSGIIAVTMNGTRGAEFNNTGSVAPTAQTVMTKQKGDAYYAAISSLEYKEDVTNIRDNSHAAFWGLQGIDFRYAGNLPNDHPLRDRITSGFALEEVAVGFPEGVKFGEYLDPMAFIAVHHEELKFIRQRAREKLDQVDTQLQAARAAIQEVQQELDLARGYIVDLRQRVAALENQ